LWEQNGMMRSKFAPLLLLALVFFASAPVLVAAQTDQASSAPGALPVVPGGQKAMDPPAAAPASLPAVHGSSPLEPYLVTWLLPVGGIFAVAVELYIDKKMRASMLGRRA
jgi:hypothetical protein